MVTANLRAAFDSFVKLPRICWRKAVVSAQNDNVTTRRIPGVDGNVLMLSDSYNVTLPSFLKEARRQLKLARALCVKKRVDLDDVGLNTGYHLALAIDRLTNPENSVFNQAAAKTGKLLSREETLNRIGASETDIANLIRGLQELKISALFQASAKASAPKDQSQLALSFYIAMKQRFLPSVERDRPLDGLGLDITFHDYERLGLNPSVAEQLMAKGLELWEKGLA